MPKFYATTMIDHGQVNDNGENERTIFDVDDEVVGLSKADMKALWEAGALRMVDDKQEVKKSDGDTSGVHRLDGDNVGSEGSQLPSGPPA